MARIRSIKPDFWTSEQVMQCCRDARLLFIGLWNFCDDAGVHPLSLKTIKSRVFPGDDDIKAADLLPWLVELSRAGLINTFEAFGQNYLRITGWDKHQRIEKPQFKHPKEGKPIPVDSQSTTDRRLEAVQSTPDRSGLEGREGSCEANASGADAPDLKRMLFGQCLSWLSEATGKPSERLRSTVGRWCKDHADGPVLEAFIAARRESPVDPVAWITAALKQRGKHGRIDHTEARRDALAGAFADCFGAGTIGSAADRAEGAGGETGIHAGAVAAAGKLPADGAVLSRVAG